MCAGNEGFYSGLYLCHFTCGPVGNKIETETFIELGYLITDL